MPLFPRLEATPSANMDKPQFISQRFIYKIHTFEEIKYTRLGWIRIRRGKEREGENLVG